MLGGHISGFFHIDTLTESFGHGTGRLKTLLVDSQVSSFQRTVLSTVGTIPFKGLPGSD